MTVTCPRYPAVPDSTSGTLAARHIRFTWERAARLSKAFITRSNFWKKLTLYWSLFFNRWKIDGKMLSHFKKFGRLLLGANY